MASQVEIIEENVEMTVGTVQNATRKTFNAGVGLAATARENVMKLYDEVNVQTNKFANKGQDVTKARRRDIKDFVRPYQERVSETTEAWEARFNKATERTLTRLNIPTADSIDQLNKKVNALSRKIDKLAK